jgi:predicted ATPase
VTPARDALGAAAERIGATETLLVFDNCEHVVEQTARVTQTLLQSCANLRVLATSRELLRVPGEAVVELEPLAAPPDGTSPEEIAAFDSVRLFLERARLQRPDLRVDDATAVHISSICRRLDGLPLAVELAAARARMLSVHDIDERLDDFAGSGMRGTADHHQTIEASIAWSVDQLSDVERSLFERLSVFAGGWTLEQAEAVCGYAPFSCDDVATVLGSLVDRSLVTVQLHGEESRFRMLETVRAFAARALDAEDAAVARARHLDHFSELAKRASDALEGPRQAMWVDRLARSDANLMAAMRFAVDTDPARGLVLATRLASYWERRGHMRTGLRWLTSAIEAAGSEVTERLAAAHLEAGHLAREAGESAAAHDHLARAQEIARACEADGTLRGALAETAALHHLEGDNESARRTYEELLEILRSRGDPKLEARVLGNLGTVAHSMRDLETARALYERALEAERAIGNQRAIAGNLSNLSSVASALYDYDAARRYAQEGLDIATALRDPSLSGMLLTRLGNALVEQGDFEGARMCYEQALAERTSAEDAPGIAIVAFCLAELDLLTGSPERAFEQATEAVAAFRSFRVPRGEAAALRVLGEVETALGRYDEATSHLKSAMALASDLGDRLLLAATAEGMASIYRATNVWDRAAEWIAIATQIRHSAGVPVPPSWAPRLEQLISSVRSTLGDEVFEAAMECARRLDERSVFALAADS